MTAAAKSLKVSVCVVTYNQEKYIRQCLQSIVDQVTDFDFELIVGEDCSTDGTRAIVQEFIDRYPGSVRAILHTKNVGGYKNYISVHSAALGEYVAHVDGDDLMKPGKLNAQVALMSVNPEASACFHLMDMVDMHSQKIEGCWLRTSYSDLIDLDAILLQHPNIGHSSLLFKRESLVDFLAARDIDFIDMHIYLHLASKGVLLPINEVLGTYRVGVGVSRNLNVLDAAIDAVTMSKSYGVEEKVILRALHRLLVGFSLQMLLVSNYDGYLKYQLLLRQVGLRIDPTKAIIFRILKNQFAFRFFSKQYLIYIKNRSLLRH